MKIFKNNNLKTVILCGGLGQRISSETKNKPKPLIKIGKLAILEHIMNIYFGFGYNNFYLLLGYKGNQIKKYFKNKKKFNITYIQTGLKTGTAGRLFKMKKYLKKNENFYLTYGDGLTNQNINNLMSLHLKMKKICTMTIVRPPARFGEVKLNNSYIVGYKEKRRPDSGWINGGFMVVNQKIFNYLSSNLSEMLEAKPMEKLSKKRNLIGYKHKGFWQCMDTLKEKEYLELLVKQGNSPWIT
jgi:glucose-1-phosphate cytidylyltransferase